MLEGADPDKSPEIVVEVGVEDAIDDGEAPIAAIGLLDSPIACKVS